jgi:hypothetical protein
MESGTMTMSDVKKGDAGAFDAKIEGAGEIATNAVSPSLADLGANFERALHAKRDPAKGLPADKEFIDSLYEDEEGDGNFALTDIETA